MNVEVDVKRKDESANWRIRLTYGCELEVRDDVKDRGWSGR